ncbi:SAM-dependent methyltransferase [Paenibacillus phyllosphaerae]|uniref:SAM-dependent methyltransferase n=1 Tax=Paenibacillus phyllosphaerae TaxID=274593 RepID=A0A7W5FKK8_9BACL|nr:class I SAM-dependent methyltransferase [Paenibacillus phyllosphaerae]MBB3108236.1 SAM-dependent methyltransferase [Paenibacillus phyllosphaerae]
MKDVYEQIGVAMTCRSYEEYVRMFDLTEEQLGQGEVLDIAGGGSSFTAALHRKGLQGIAVDPRYKPGIDQWIAEASLEIETSTAKLGRLKDKFDWTYYGNIENHRASRERSLQLFADDLNSADADRRYIEGALPQLPFADNRFQTIVCSHFLFLYADQFGLDFHLQAIAEMVRVCAPGGTIKIYPLLSLQWVPYPHLPHIVKEASRYGGTTELYPSRLPFIPGSDQGLQIKL